jgi:hypothetical protein
VASKDSNPLDAFESLNIEGILDEALRLDEPEEEPVGPKPHRAKAMPEPEPVEEEDSMFSGLLDEALGSQETESILDSVLGGRGGASGRHITNPPTDRSDPMREIEVELLGEGLEPVEEEKDSRPHLSELIKTRVSIPAERHITNAPEKAAAKEAAKASRPIEVPITIEIDAEAADQDIELLLKIRLKRK